VGLRWTTRWATGAGTLPVFWSSAVLAWTAFGTRQALMSRLKELLARNPPPTAQDINNAFWQACAGGQRRAAECLLEQGADINWIPDYAKVTPLDAAGTIHTARGTLVALLSDRGAKSAKS
jgi:uncharacterized protein